MDPGHRRAGINKQRVFPLPVPAITTQSRWCSISREAWSWKTCGTIWPCVINEMIRQALSTLSLSLLFNVSRYSWGNQSWNSIEDSCIRASNEAHWTSSASIVMTSRSMVCGLMQMVDSWSTLMIAHKASSRPALINFDNSMKIIFKWFSLANYKFFHWMEVTLSVWSTHPPYATTNFTSLWTEHSSLNRHCWKFLYPGSKTAKLGASSDILHRSPN